MRINAVESSTKGGADASEQEEGDDDGEEGGDEDYEVDRVVSYCKSGLNKNKYLVHWKGVDMHGRILMNQRLILLGFHNGNKK